MNGGTEMYFERAFRRKGKFKKVVVGAIASGVISTTLLAGGPIAYADQLEVVETEVDTVTGDNNDVQGGTNEDVGISGGTENGALLDEPDETNLESTDEAVIDDSLNEESEDSSEDFEHDLDLIGYDPSKPYVIIKDSTFENEGVLLVSKGLQYQQLLDKLSNDWPWEKIALYTTKIGEIEALSDSEVDEEDRALVVLITDPYYILSEFDILARNGLVDFINEHLDEINNREDVEVPEDLLKDALVVIPYLPPFTEKNHVNDDDEIKYILDRIDREKIDFLKSEIQSSVNTQEGLNKLVSSLETELLEVKAVEAELVAKFEVAVAALIKENSLDKATGLSALFLKALEKEQISSASLKEYVTALISGIEDQAKKKEFLEKLIEKAENEGLDSSILSELLKNLN